MAKVRTSNLSNLKNKKAKQQNHLHISLNKMNFYIIGLGIAIIIVGYMLMAENSVDGFLPTVISPIFLFIGYCVIVPVGILYKPRETAVEGVVQSQSSTIKTTDTEEAVSRAGSSNIKTS